MCSSKIIGMVDVGVGQVITLDLGLSNYRVGLTDGKWGYLSQDHNFFLGGGSPISVLTVLAQLCYPGEVQGLITR